MRKLIYLVLCILILSSTAPVFACRQSHGKSEKDKQVAERICRVFKDIPDILMMSVQEMILYVDISRQFYDAMMSDKLSATELITIWMRAMRKEYGQSVVTVWVYVDTIKVMEGDTSWTGEDRIKFLIPN